jgi:hypothetical protein
MEYTAEHYTCQKCVRPPKKESIRMPQGPRLPVMNSYHTSIRDPRDLPITGDEWSDPQVEDPELSVIMSLVANDDPRIIECGFLVDDVGVLRKLDKKGDKKIVVPLAVRRPLMQAMHDHPLASHLGTFKTYNKLKHIHGKI